MAVHLTERVWSNPLLGSNIKMAKAGGYGCLMRILNFAPHELLGHNVCPFSTYGCRRSCINTCFGSDSPRAQARKIERVLQFKSDRLRFLLKLKKELRRLERDARQEALEPVARLNGTSDLSWEKISPSLFSDFADVQYTDYTKIPKRYRQFLDGQLPSNYHLVFSRSERNEGDCIKFLKAGGSVAVVFRKKPFPKEWMGFRAIDGTEHDLRFLDDPNVVVGLKALRKAMTDRSGFVVD